MIKSHIIIGYGVWAKKIINFLRLSNFFDKIIVLTRKKQFYIFPYYKKIKKKDLKEIYSSTKSIHISSNNNSHFFYAIKYLNIFKNIIVEKPLINSQKDFLNVDNLYKKKNKIIVNYTDLFNPLFIKIKKIFYKNYNKKINVNIFYHSLTKKFSKKYELIYDFLDHPLSIILKLLKFFPKFKIINFNSNYKNSFLKETLTMQYKYLNIIFNFTITNETKKKIRKININTKNKKFFFNLNTPLNRKKTNSFLNLYKTLNKKNISGDEFDVSFHKEIYKEKIKIIKKLKNI